MRNSDWSSDVCSSDLIGALIAFGGYLAWRHIDQGNRGEQAEALVAALDKANTSQPKAATEALDRIIAEDNGDRKSVVSGKRVSVRVDLGGRRIIKKKNTIRKKIYKCILRTITK